eukprot:SAG11_NODE_9036_length_950_cov_1.532315_1_plen_137_part_10
MGKAVGAGGAGWALFGDAAGASAPLLEGRAYLGPYLTANIAEWAAVVMGLEAALAAGARRLVLRPDSGNVLGHLPADLDVTWSDGAPVRRYRAPAPQFRRLRGLVLAAVARSLELSARHVRAHGDMHVETLGNKHVD